VKCDPPDSPKLDPRGRGDVRPPQYPAMEDERAAIFYILTLDSRIGLSQFQIYKINNFNWLSKN